MVPSSVGKELALLVELPVDALVVNQSQNQVAKKNAHTVV